MPPKKRGRLPARATSTQSGDPADESIVVEKGDTTNPRDGMISKAWTDEQEASLFKAMIRWKPVGMHKHFRMIAISENLRSNGHNGYGAVQAAQMTIPGIWEKLASLYNLDVLDLREDSTVEPMQEEDEESPEIFYDFALPDDEFLDMTFARRLSSEGSSSPPSLPYQLSTLSFEGGKGATRYSTVDDTDEPRSSPTSTTRGTPSGRSTRTSKGTRTSRLAEVSVPGGRQGSKGSTERGSDEEIEDDAMDVDEDVKKATVKGKDKASQVAKGKVSTRKSGRKR